VPHALRGPALRGRVSGGVGSELGWDGGLRESFDPSQALSQSWASGEKSKARDIIAAIRTLQRIEQEHRAATPEERETLARFGGFGAVALSIFPNPVTGLYKDASWQALGEELQSLLSPEEYDSAKRTTFNAFYTSPTVIERCTRRSPAWASEPVGPQCSNRVAAPGIS
jgi:acyl-CoA reductase-like NAD-dependent aldehyde dehydrogenase